MTSWILERKRGYEVFNNTLFNKNPSNFISSVKREIAKKMLN